MPMDRKRYPDNWDEVAFTSKLKAGFKCEHCGVADGMWRIGKTFGKPYKVIISVAHLNHEPSDIREENLRALCQECHLQYDALEHSRNGSQTKQRKKREAMIEAGQLELFTDKQQIEVSA